MKTNFSLGFYLKKQKNYVSRNVPIYMRITAEGNRAEIAINRDCDLKRWNAKGGRAIGSNEKIKLLNTHLD
ncbi:Arm DNA-binding domain-containing protein [Pedobacter sp. WC2423]|uniref:Arm DNA-binding domain-containing protein n=1 Tax=Pedobacter sp. WC2423 TaxID=3234142 RepID=UPI0034667F35